MWGKPHHDLSKNNMRKLEIEPAHWAQSGSTCCRDLLIFSCEWGGTTLLYREEQAWTQGSEKHQRWSYPTAGLEVTTSFASPTITFATHTSPDKNGNISTGALSKCCHFQKHCRHWQPSKNAIFLTARIPDLITWSSVSLIPSYGMLL